MLKLYRKQDGKFEYWETWDKDKRTGIVHWGNVGETGSNKEVKSQLLRDFHKTIQFEVNDRLKSGFNPIGDDEHRRLIIEYRVDGHGSNSDLEKRHKLERRMNETLGWKGLGNCDGGSIGSGSMEVCCFVVDFEIAKSVIETDLRNSEFENYTRIYDEDRED